MCFNTFVKHCNNEYVTLDHKTLSHWGMFVVIANNALYGSKLSIFLLCQKSLRYYVKFMFHEDI